MRALTLALLLPLAACGTGSSQLNSYVAKDISPGDVPALSSAVVAFVTMRQPPGPLMLQPPPGDAPGLTERITADLRAAGHAVSPGGRNRLAYQVEPYGPRTLLVRVALDDARGARVLARTSGGALGPSGPYTVSLAGAGR